VISFIRVRRSESGVKELRMVAGGLGFRLRTPDAERLSNMPRAPPI